MRSLAQLAVGETGTVLSIRAEARVERRLLEMGLTPGTRVTLIRRAPLGDPIGIMLRGYALTLRARDAETVGIEVNRS